MRVDSASVSPRLSPVAGPAPFQRARREFIGAFESTYLPAHGVDVAEASGHVARWRHDIDALAQAGIKRVRYPLRWHRIEAISGIFDWRGPDAELAYLRQSGLEPILDLVHHTSYPGWLDDGFRDRRFPRAYLRYAEAIALRYDWISGYTLFNEPFATLFLAGHEALWPPYDHGIEGFVRLLNNVLPAICDASVLFDFLLPNADHVWVDTCESHTAEDDESEAYARLATDRRHVVLDLALKHELDPERPFLRQLLLAGGEGLLELPPARVDVIGLDYYCHSEWSYDVAGAHSPSRKPKGFAALAAEYGARYALPMILSETNIRGLPSDRASWLRYMIEQYELAVADGVGLHGFCWFPVTDSCDWDSLLSRSAARMDPVGVFSVVGGRRERTLFTRVWERAASGAPIVELPCYRFQSPCDQQFSALLPQVAHWRWLTPPPAEQVPPIAVARIEEGDSRDNAHIA